MACFVTVRKPRLFKGELAASPDEGDTGIGWKAKLLRRANQVFSGAYIPQAIATLVTVVHHWTEQKLPGRSQSVVSHSSETV